MEAIERYSGIFQGDEIRVTRRFTDFPSGDAIFPNDVLLFSEAQFAKNNPDEPPPWTPALFDPSAEIEWSPVWSLRDGRFKYLPTSILYFFYRGPGEFLADSNGCAAGNTLEEAIVQGFLELVERDAYAIWWYNRLQRAEVDLGKLDDSYVCNLQTQLAETGRRLWVLDVTSDLGIPSFIAISHWVQNSQENIEFGSGAHFDSRIALLRALTELNQFLSIGLMGGGTGEKSSLDGSTPLRLRDHPFLTSSDNPAIQLEFGSKFGRLDTCEQVSRLRPSSQARGSRFPGPQSDAPRYRRSRGQSDRSGNAAFLSPLRAWPALRCSGKARISRAATVGDRAQSNSSSYLRVILSCALPQERDRDGLRRQLYPLGSAPMLRSKRTRPGRLSPPSMVTWSAWERSAPALRTACKICASVCHSPRLHPADETSTRRFTCWSGD